MGLLVMKQIHSINTTRFSSQNSSEGETCKLLYTGNWRHLQWQIYCTCIVILGFILKSVLPSLDTHVVEKLKFNTWGGSQNSGWNLGQSFTKSCRQIHNQTWNYESTLVFKVRFPNTLLFAGDCSDIKVSNLARVGNNRLDPEKPFHRIWSRRNGTYCMLYQVAS